MTALSPRQRQIVRWLAAGLTYRQIAGEMHLSESTIKSYAGDAYARLGATNAANAVHVAHQRGLLGGEP